MTYDISFSSSAEDDLKSIRRWYQDIDSALGNDFILSVNDELAHIQNYPSAYSVFYKKFRRAVIRRFPYGILFRPEKEIIKVSGIIHTSRSIGLWMSRVQ